MRKLILFIPIFIITGTLLLFLFDPPFKCKLEFENHTIEYDWRIFNNDFCNYRTHDHCADNEFNKYNAEIELLNKLAESYDGQKVIENRLMEVVNQLPMYKRIYSNLTKSSELKVDSIIKYREEIFQRIWIE
ncbi:hypothetical protein D7030_03910 [Flavobacteriaceae bacterium AU392]|nr:hypothetical protein D1817_10385 [Flavobacteriaceae bacterium]RKM85821.1 hypothetical protein D7030_03910 [Flavobacteriaceae bacterium AU392]